MTMIMIEGFEMISTALNLSAVNVRDLFQANLPDEVNDWFSSSGDSVSHEVAGRIDGNCLTFTRGANASPSWSADQGANLGFSFIPKQKMTMGWAVQYSAPPVEPIPLACFRYDAGSGDTEQISLWATPDAKVYVSLTPYNTEYTALTPGINPLAVTPSNAFRFTRWTYFELAIDYSGTLPVVSVLINGVVVLDSITDASLMQMPLYKYVSSAHILNPSNSHFNNASYWQRVDDFYLDDETTHGPQWIVPLINDVIATNTGWNDIPSSQYPSITPISGTYWGDVITWELGPIPADVGVVTAIGVSIIGDQAVTLDAVDFGVCNATDGGVQSKKGSLAADEPPKCLRFCTIFPPSPLAMTGASLAAMRGYMRANQVVV